jgi:PadR family transcriptional regulator, regulatory protein AphA
MALSRTAYVILGMLRLGRRTGYEIKGLVDVSTRFFWAASYGQIYPELANLEELGLVVGHSDHSDGRRRREYELTPAGEEALQEWLTSDAELHLELRHEGFLKLFFSDALSPEEQLDQLRRIRAKHERVAEELRAIEPDARREPHGGLPRGSPDVAGGDGHGVRCPYLTLEWGIAYEDFLVDWCTRTEARLAKELAGTGEARR